MVSGTGLGNPEPAKLMNQGNLNMQFADDALATYFKNSGADYQVESDKVAIGIEPSYQGDPLLIIEINRDKSKSYIQRGKSFGPYGSQVVQKTSVYGEYKRKSKFVKFVDKWHEVLFSK
jgi:hypothetical protein